MLYIIYIISYSSLLTTYKTFSNLSKDNAFYRDLNSSRKGQLKLIEIGSICGNDYIFYSNLRFGIVIERSQYKSIRYRLIQGTRIQSNAEFSNMTGIDCTIYNHP